MPWYKPGFIGGVFVSSGREGRESGKVGGMCFATWGSGWWWWWWWLLSKRYLVLVGGGEWEVGFTWQLQHDQAFHTSLFAGFATSDIQIANDELSHLVLQTHDRPGLPGLDLV
ncbi:hypothetical protein BO71DRAFT_32865 [Aspergillus ellipticus CBS 707.79]|uniref:Uncharacterized protein n=1 Tax=Aspergillus ellipticus CBS 707.79 TaxID=1448320 RepID=A0A319DPY4_9EURO|nr:hypothetical protein BO71DRAFT_32865 [Aspergillus ellipticus CBS 707.79]